MRDVANVPNFIHTQMKETLVLSKQLRVQKIKFCCEIKEMLILKNLKCKPS